MTIFDELAAPFPKESIHWRAQSLTKDGSKAMALAYLDARDVMERLDAVCGPDGWQTEHYDCGGKMGCKIGVRSPYVSINPETKELSYQWVWKSDGAGETQVEADKGAFSGAFKRAGVMWGIGRYLYDMPTIWVPCESYQKGDKYYWKKWTVDPWSRVPVIKGGVNPNDESGADSVRTTVADLPRNEQEWKEWSMVFKTAINGCNTVDQVTGCLKRADATLKACKAASVKLHAHVLDYAQGRREILETPTDNTLLGAG